jgi:GMP synthase (glutamine-hydrolysing)
LAEEMRVLVIENFRGTPLGQLQPALEKAGAEIDIRSAHLGAALPDDDGTHDALIILGGGQTALDDTGSSWLPQVVRLVRRFGDTGKPVLGICLGAQLVARAYGASNIIGRPLEFGWHEIRLTGEGRSDPVVSAPGDATPVFHWHEDTFTLPPGALHLARSDLTEIQAFRLGRNVYGMQFHFEADRALVARWSEDFAEEIAANTPDWPGRRDADAARHGKAADAAGRRIAEAWVRLIQPRQRRKPRLSLPA